MSQKYEIECKKSFIIYCRKNCRKTLNERKQAEETNDILVRKFKLSDWQVHTTVKLIVGILDRKYKHVKKKLIMLFFYQFSSVFFKLDANLTYEDSFVNQMGVQLLNL